MRATVLAYRRNQRLRLATKYTERSRLVDDGGEGKMCYGCFGNGTDGRGDYLLVGKKWGLDDQCGFCWGGGAIVLGRIMDVGGGLGPESNISLPRRLLVPRALSSSLAI